MTFDRTSEEREGGFTLVELLMAVAVSSILIVAVSTAFIAILRGTASAHDRLVASNGSHSFSTYFTADVESANPDFATIDASATMGCATEPPGSTTKLLHLKWSERTTSTDLRAFSVSYRILGSDTDSVPGDDRWKLVRYACSSSGNPATTDVDAILSGGSLNEHVVVSGLYDPTGASNITKATIDPVSRVVELVAYAAKAKDETNPFSYTFSGTMRTPEPAPRVLSIKRNGPATVLAATTSVAWTVAFSEDVKDTTVDAGDFTLTPTGNASGVVVTGVSKVTDSVYTVTAGTSTAAGQGTVALTVDDNDTILAVSDSDKLGGAGIDNGNATGGGYTIDRVAPSVVVAQSTSQADPTGTTPILFTATFSESVTGFDAADVTYTGSAPAGASITVSGSGQDYVISFNSVPGSGSRTITPSIAAGTATDAAGNGNAASTSTDNTVTYNPAGPTPTIASVDLWNGGTAGKLEKGDKIIVTFNEAMTLSTFCSSWTSNSSDYTIDGNNKVNVEVNNNDAAGGDDELLVTTGGGVCSFNFGSIDLGSANYVISDTDFKGSGADQSTIQWTASTKTLTITLGAPDKTTGTVTTSAPEYTVDADLRTSTGGTVNNSPLTLASEQQF